MPTLGIFDNQGPHTKCPLLNHLIRYVIIFGVILIDVIGTHDNLNRVVMEVLNDVIEDDSE